MLKFPIYCMGYRLVLIITKYNQATKSQGHEIETKDLATSNAKDLSVRSAQVILGEIEKKEGKIWEI